MAARPHVRVTDATHVLETPPGKVNELMLACEVIARCLSAGGIEIQFGLPGEGNIAIATALQESGVDFVCARREDAAVSMADGWARRTGKTGFVSVTHGPGLTNTVTALTEAARHGTPLVLLTGVTPRSSRHNPQRFPAEQLAGLTGAGWLDVRGVEHIGEDVRAALANAAAERRPYVLGVDADLLYVEVKPDVADRAVAVAGSVLTGVTQPALAPADDAVSAAVDLIRRARTPLIVAGRGAARGQSAHAIRELGEHLGAPLSTTLVAKGLFTGSTQDMGICGGFASAAGAELIAESDLILAFGCSINPWTSWFFGRGAGDDPALIHVDSDPGALGRWRVPDLGVIGDAGLVARELLLALRGGGSIAAQPRRPDFVEAKELAEANPVRSWDGAPFRVTEVGLAARRWFPTGAVLSSDTGQATADVVTYVEVSDPTSFIYPIHAGSIGLGLGSAIGAAMADRDRWTVHFTGDGSLMMGLQELATAAQFAFADHRRGPGRRGLWRRGPLHPRPRCPGLVGAAPPSTAGQDRGGLRHGLSPHRGLGRAGRHAGAGVRARCWTAHPARPSSPGLREPVLP